MNLRAYLSSRSGAERDQFAVRCGTTRGHLQNIMYGIRPCATDLAVCIERESANEVRRWDLRPDDWFRHWPELVAIPGAPDLAGTTTEVAAAGQ